MSALTSPPTSHPLQRIVACILVLLLIPFVASLFTHEVSWNASDYVIAAILLLATGMACTLAWRTVRSPVLRSVFVALLALLLTAVWVHLAVGIF